MIKCCVFDLDGTLFNTLTTITYYVNRTLAAHGVAPISEEECCAAIGHGARHLIDTVLSYRPECRLDPVAVLDEYSAMYNADTLYLTVPYADIDEMLSALKAGGVKLAVLSNKPHETTVDIISKYFPDTFDLVFGGRAGVPLKPAPDALLMMLGDMGVSPAEAAYIGDTGVDIATGKATECALSIGVSWGFRSRDELCRAGADVIADTPYDITAEVLSYD